tara:strand:- start:810 stop:1079 length:270 start_codon:yes stop_codon:yes gene_type:complete
MGGVKNKIKNFIVDTVTDKKIIKPKLKTPEEGKKTSDALDKKLTENAEEGNEAAAELLIKRKGRRKTILTSGSGLDEDEISTKKTMLGG